MFCRPGKYFFNFQGQEVEKFSPWHICHRPCPVVNNDSEEPENYWVFDKYEHHCAPNARDRCGPEDNENGFCCTPVKSIFGGSANLYREYCHIA